MEKPSLLLQKALRVVVPMLELYWPLLISALCESMPVPDKVQETGTVMLIWSTTEVLSSAETMLEAESPPEKIVSPTRLSEVATDSLLLFDVFVFMWCVTLSMLYTVYSSYTYIIPHRGGKVNSDASRPFTILLYSCYK